MADKLQKESNHILSLNNNELANKYSYAIF